MRCLAAELAAGRARARCAIALSYDEDRRSSESKNGDVISQNLHSISLCRSSVVIVIYPTDRRRLSELLQN